MKGLNSLLMFKLSNSSKSKIAIEIIGARLEAPG